MDDFERDLRATFDRLAGDADPSSELVERAVERSAQIRRRRRTALVSIVATIAVAVSITAASIAGAGTRNHHLQVTGPTLAGTSSSTTTTTPTSTTVTVVPPVTPPGRRTTPPRSTTPTTIRAGCAPLTVADTSGALTLLGDGDIQVEFYFTSAPGGATVHWALDDGTTGAEGFTMVYSPDQFGTHSFDTWTVDGRGARSCTVHHTFVVEPDAASTTTTTVPGGSTTTSSLPDSTTFPAETTVPDTSTTVGP